MRSLGTVRRDEWRRVIAFVALVMLLTTLPYLVGWRAANQDRFFGGLVFAVDDGNTYLAKMRLGARGDWLFTMRYTHEPHAGALLLLPYIILGKVAALVTGAGSPHLASALIVTYHAARIVFSSALLLVSYRVVAVFLPRPVSRMTALILIALGGGLGWLLALFGQHDLFGSLPLDFFVPEAYSFLVIFGLPHIALARTALLLGVLLMFRALLEPDTPRAWLRWTLPAGLSWAVMGLCVPFYIAVLYLLMGCWGLAIWVRQRSFPWALFWRAVSAAAIPLPVLIYTAIVFLTNDVLGRWSGQNNLYSPHPLHYVLGYGVFAVPAVSGVRWAWRRGKRSRAGVPHVLLAVWVLVMPVVVYVPVNVQRRLAEGVIVPLSILAVAGLRLWFPRQRAWRRARVVVLILALPTAGLLLLGATFSATQRERPLFHPADDLRAMARLNTVAAPDAVVFSTKETGNYLPVYTDLVAYVGHGPETLDGSQKARQAERFFRGEMPPDERHDILAVVDYVFYGQLERELGGTETPAWAEELRLVEGFAPGDLVVVYEVPHASD